MRKKESDNLTEDVHYQELGSKAEHLGKGGRDVPASRRRLLSSNHLKKAAWARQDFIHAFLRLRCRSMLLTIEGNGRRILIKTLRKVLHS